jgi:hypothetical protein
MTRLSFLFVLLLLSAGVAATEAPPQRDLRFIPLPNTSSVDLSPDETLVASVSAGYGRADCDEGKCYPVSVRLHDLAKGSVVAEQEFHDPLHPRGHYVRFVPDGKEVVASVANVLHVLSVPELREIRTIEMSNVLKILPPSIPFKEFAIITAMEVSPDGETVAVIRPDRGVSGVIELYALASGKRVATWPAPAGWLEFSKGLVWSGDGRNLYLAVPESPPCDRFGLSRISEYEVARGAVVRQLNIRLLTGSVALADADRVFAVSLDCVQTSGKPKLQVFSLSTAKKLAELDGRGSGVRYLVAASGDRSRIVAFTGKLKKKFDWGDMHFFEKPVDATFSVWNTRDYSGVVTSQHIPWNPQLGEVRMSRTGRFVAVAGAGVYEIP